jgi:predicted short-subunit dehydrogenase-like oxidoreductase (DUF2520 family)
MSNETKHKISVVGAGRLGGALALALARKNFEIENLIVKNQAKAEKIARAINPAPKILSPADAGEIASEILIFATQDSEIERAAENASEKISSAPRFVFHTSGSLSSEILSVLKEKGSRTGSLHPLVSVSDARLGAERFKNAYFCVEGDAEAVAMAEKIVAALEGKSFSIATRHKPLYHAAAVTAAGHLVALVDVALEIMQQCGLDEAAAQTVLLPLIKSSVENLESQTTSQALTGTFARADVGTFERHLNALDEDASAEAREIYLSLGARSAQLAERQGADRENLRKILRQISLAKKNFKC